MGRRLACLIRQATARPSGRAFTVGLVSMSPAQFWSWFQGEAWRFRDLEVPEKDKLLDEIQERLHSYCDQLWFEIGGDETSNVSEMTISAEGAREFFPQVRRLVQAAPEIPGWEIRAFKRSQGFSFELEYAGITLSPGETWFLPLASAKRPGELGLRVAYADYRPSDREIFLAATYILLDTGLGELETAEAISFLEACETPDSPRDEGFMLLNELPAYLAGRIVKDDLSG